MPTALSVFLAATLSGCLIEGFLNKSAHAIPSHSLRQCRLTAAFSLSVSQVSFLSLSVSAVHLINALLEHTLLENPPSSPAYGRVQCRSCPQAPHGADFCNGLATMRCTAGHPARAQGRQGTPSPHGGLSLSLLAAPRRHLLPVPVSPSDPPRNEGPQRRGPGQATPSSPEDHFLPTVPFKDVPRGGGFP